MQEKASIKKIKKLFAICPHASSEILFFIYYEQKSKDILEIIQFLKVNFN